MPHPKQIFKLTQTYARRNSIPISNLVELAYRCPFSGQRKVVVREYCDKRQYSEAFKRVVRDSLKKNPFAAKALDELHSAQKAKRNPAPAPAPPHPPVVVDVVDSSQLSISSSSASIGEMLREQDKEVNAGADCEVETAVAGDEKLGETDTELSKELTAALEGVIMLKQPKQLVATLHEHQVCLAHC